MQSSQASRAKLQTSLGDRPPLPTVRICRRSASPCIRRNSTHSSPIWSVVLHLIAQVMLHRWLRHRAPSNTLASILASSGGASGVLLAWHLTSPAHSYTAAATPTAHRAEAAPATAVPLATATYTQSAVVRLPLVARSYSSTSKATLTNSLQMQHLALHPLPAYAPISVVHQPQRRVLPHVCVATPRHEAINGNNAAAVSAASPSPSTSVSNLRPGSQHNRPLSPSFHASTLSPSMQQNRHVSTRNVNALSHSTQQDRHPPPCLSANALSHSTQKDRHPSAPIDVNALSQSPQQSRHVSTSSQAAMAAASNTPPSLGPSDPGAAGPGPSSQSLAWQVQRGMSDEPQGVVYTGPSSPPAKHVTLRTLRQKYQRKEPITMVTAYDYPSAVHVDEAGIDILLIGDSVAMVVHGHDTTLPISLDEMLVHCRAVARGARRAFLVGDMPFGSYETGVRDAVISAMRMLKEGGVDAVKLEGGSPARVDAAKAIVEAGVAVMGHVGLTPQSISVLGGFRPQAQVADEALNVLRQAQALQRAGCFSLVLECVPGPIAAAITASVDIPTIGIGAGGATSGQVLVYHDLLGMMSHPHHAKVTPKFCKQYAQVGKVIQAAIQQYRDEVVSGAFPSTTYSPYRIPQEQLDVLIKELRQSGAAAAAQAVEEAIHAEMAPSN